MKNIATFFFCLFFLISLCSEKQVNDDKIEHTDTINTTNIKNLDIFEKEIELIENTIQLYQRKIEVIRQIRDSYLINRKTIIVN